MATKETIQIVGLEISEGTSRKTDKPYSIGTVYTMTRLAPPLGGGSNVAKGFMGDRYPVEVEVLRPIAHNSFPINAEITKETVMRFGKREEIITAIVPVKPEKAAA